MAVVEMRFAFEHERQAQTGFDAARDFIADSGMGVVVPCLEGREVTFASSDTPQLADVGESNTLFMELCFFWARWHSDAPFTGVGRLMLPDGRLYAEKVFYDGYVLGFKSLRDVKPDFDESAWREVNWQMWIPLHGHFVDLEGWRTGTNS